MQIQNLTNWLEEMEKQGAAEIGYEVDYYGGVASLIAQNTSGEVTGTLPLSD